MVDPGISIDISSRPPPSLDLFPAQLQGSERARGSPGQRSRNAFGSEASRARSARARRDVAHWSHRAATFTTRPLDAQRWAAKQNATKHFAAAAECVLTPPPRLDDAT